MSDNRLFYSDGNTEVNIGDEVKLRVWPKSLWYLRGIVMFISRISPATSDIRLQSPVRIGIRLLKDNSVVTVPYERGTNCFSKGLRFIKRGTSPSAPAMKEAGRLYYYGTEDEVRLGDRVLFKRLLFRNVTGIVCYLPGQSEPHPQMVDEMGLHDWAIVASDGSIWSWPFFPTELQPSRKIILLRRNNPFTPLDPKEEFH